MNNTKFSSEWRIFKYWNHCYYEKMTSKMKLTFKKILYKFKTNHMGVIYPG